MNLLAPTFLFRFAVPCRRIPELWSEEIELPEAYRIPSFAELENRPLFADLRSRLESCGHGRFSLRRWQEAVTLVPHRATGR